MYGRAQASDAIATKSRESNRWRLRGEIALHTLGVAWRVELCVAQRSGRARFVCVCAELIRFCLSGDDHNDDDGW